MTPSPENNTAPAQHSGDGNSTAPALSHVNAQGTAAMVDVSMKTPSHRMAHARTVVRLGGQIMAELQGGELTGKKGPVFQTAIIAGVMAAKRTGELIPLCHPIGLNDCQVTVTPIDGERVRVDCIAKVFAPTGVEMEALTGASVAALTIYDMCKAMSHDITIEQTQLMEKRGGKRDFQRNDEQ